MGIFNNIFTEMAKTAGQDGQVMIDATHLKAHRSAASLLKKGLFPAGSDAQKARWCRQIISAHNEIHLICTAARKERLRFA